MVTWITRNGHKIKLEKYKGYHKGIHPDYFHITGDDSPQHVLDRKHALEIAKAKVRVINNRYSMKHDDDKIGHKEIHRMAQIYTQHLDKGEKIDKPQMVHELTRSGIPMRKAIAVVEKAHANPVTHKLDFSSGWFH